MKLHGDSVFIPENPARPILNCCIVVWLESELKVKIEAREM
jgi:hypothetical protein